MVTDQIVSDAARSSFYHFDLSQKPPARVNHLLHSPFNHSSVLFLWSSHHMLPSTTSQSPTLFSTPFPSHTHLKLLICNNKSVSRLSCNCGLRVYNMYYKTSHWKQLSKVYTQTFYPSVSKSACFSEHDEEPSPRCASNHSLKHTPLP